MQALAYGTRHIIDSLNAAGHRITRVVLTGGGTRNALLLREHADATGCDLHLGSEDQAVTLGAAILAATASGAFADLQAAAAVDGACRRHDPRRSGAARVPRCQIRRLSGDVRRLVPLPPVMMADTLPRFRGLGREARLTRRGTKPVRLGVRHSPVTRVARSAPWSALRHRKVGRRPTPARRSRRADRCTKGDHHAVIQLAEAEPQISAGRNEVLLVTNADLRESANVECWPVQEKFEHKLHDVLADKFGITLRRAHPVKADKGHGFISSQREGSDLFARIDPDAPVIVLLTAWQYSHHLAASLLHHRGPILLLANFDGTWPGLVGMLCMAGTLTSLGKPCSRLWSENFDDAVLPGRAARLARHRSDRARHRATCIRSPPTTR